MFSLFSGCQHRLVFECWLEIPGHPIYFRFREKVLPPQKLQVHLPEEQKEHLSLLCYLRAYYAVAAWEEGVHWVNSHGSLMHLYCDTAILGLRIALRTSDRVEFVVVLETSPEGLRVILLSIQWCSP